MNVRSLALNLALACLALSVIGCGGGKGTVVNAFSGQYTGTWKNASQNGTAVIAIDDNGKISGQLHNTTLSADGSISGTIDNQGNATGMFVYGATSVNYTGVLTLTPSIPTHLTGSLNQDQYDLIEQ